MKKLDLAIVLAFFMLLSPSYSSAAQLSVPSGYATIQAAIDDAAPGDEVVVSDGTYAENINFGGKAITVTSVNGATSTTIDGGGSGSVVTFDSSEDENSVLNGFTVQNGATGIYCTGVSPTISNCIITNNTGTTVNTNLVGGINSYASSLTITDSTISNNAGWALYNYPGSGSLVMTGSLVDSNGGGVLFTGGETNVSKSVFTDNNNSGLRISLTGTATFTNCLIAQNDSDDRAGGIYVVNANLVNIMNCTISDNTAQIYLGAGGVYLHSSTIPLVITNSILTGNTLQGINNFYNIYPNDYQSNIDISYTQLNQSVYSAYGPGNIYTSVHFVDSANGEYRLSPNSYNIDAGTSNGAPIDDLDGISRPQNGVYDMGAYEFTCTPDGDGDGYFASDGCGNSPVDCNDSNASIHPGKAENCTDGIDNDCDGDTDGADEDCFMTCTEYISTDDNPYGCSTGKFGICYNGTRECTSDTWGDCIQDNQPEVEICDGLDNDCDGRFDEGLGTSDCDTGLPGECTAGIASCKYYNNVYGWVCEAIKVSSAETCDGLDNDCDGTTDEDLISGCNTGLLGVCEHGTITCEEGGTGTWGSCVQTNQPVAEICDGQDNDCDGEVDEGFDSDGDGTSDCTDGCPDDPNKIAVGACGCGVPDTDTDSDGTIDCVDECPDNPDKIFAGPCGCGVTDCPQLPIIDPDTRQLFYYTPQFGSSVAISDDGTTAVIGAIHAVSEPYTGNGYNNMEFASGRVFIFKLIDNTWVLQQKLDHPTPWTTYYFGSSVSLSGDGSTILVGSQGTSDPYASQAYLGMGAGYVYVLNESTWELQQELIPSDPAIQDYFGSSVTLSFDGNTAVIGAKNAEEPGDPASKGAAYVFVRNAGVWTQQQRLKGSGGAPEGEELGWSVSLSDDGNTLIAGAPKGKADAITTAYHGLAYVFTRNGTTWTQEQMLYASVLGYQKEFGVSVSLSRDGNTAIVGTAGLYNSGEAYVFTRSGTTWTEHQKIVPADNAYRDLFGVSVAISGDADRAIIGARYATIGGISQGAAYTYTLEGTTWVEQFKHFSEYGRESDYYGNSVAISDDGYTALAGGPLDDSGGKTNQGAVYVIPTIIDSISPARGVTDAVIDSAVTVTFDLSMNGGTIDDTSFTLTNGGPVEGTVNYDDATMTATFTPISSLTSSTGYLAGLTGIENGAGEIMAPFLWSFTTNLIDTDNDGLGDDIEDANGNGIFDVGETDPNNPDTDNDGLNDGVEDANHNGLVDGSETDPRDDDTDSDGMPDGWETDNSLDPLVDDADDDLDGDRFSNIEEYLKSTDPNDASLHPSRAMPWIPLLLE